MLKEHEELIEKTIAIVNPSTKMLGVHRSGPTPPLIPARPFPNVVLPTTTDPVAASMPLSMKSICAVSVMLATFMEVLDTAIVAVALPYIAGSLSASTSEAT